MTETLQYGWGVSVIHTDNMNSIVYSDSDIVKLYRGETAWSDAERFAEDLVLERRYA